MPLNHFSTLASRKRNSRATTYGQTTPVMAPRPGLLAIALLILASAAAACAPRPVPGPQPDARVGRPMYQMDAEHTGRSPYVGPRHPLLLRTFDTSVVPTPDPIFGNADIQSSAAIAPDGT